ncbi:MAG TPA: hypothetical protein VE033_19035 [Acetobacteraceae bacterium]|jgi:hypothetical protein|nr:hypothetical protein [Acetobacteraceae bacterium]
MRVREGLKAIQAAGRRPGSVLAPVIAHGAVLLLRALAVAILVSPLVLAIALILR